MVEGTSFAGAQKNERRHQTAVKNLSNKLGDKDILQKKTPISQKYGNVKSNVDTGKTMK
jgi:hypothetical protein